VEPLCHDRPDDTTVYASASLNATAPKHPRGTGTPGRRPNPIPDVSTPKQRIDRTVLLV